MLRKASLTASVVGIGILVGFALSRIPALRTAHAQEMARPLVQGHGRASTSVKPTASEQFIFSVSNPLRGAFKVVPAGKRFVLTDIMYLAQGSVRQDLFVNIANAYPTMEKHSILFQVKLSPGESDQVHLCSGYVIPAGTSIIAFTNAGLEPEQHVTIWVTGYLADD